VEPVVIDATGWYARILQHEIDHLGGVLYIDRMNPRFVTTEIENGPFRQDRPELQAFPNIFGLFHGFPK
jgi:peptide deformylase